MTKTIKVDGKDYALEQLSEDAKNQLANIQAADSKLNQLKQEIALIQTARNAYVQALIEKLPSVGVQ